MSSDTRNDGEQADRRLIREAREEAYHARRALVRDLPDPSPQTKIEVAGALADWYDALAPYRGSRALETPIDERIPVDPIRLLEETIDVDQPLNRANPHAVESKTLPLAASIAPHSLIELGKELDLIALELGFAAEARQPTPEDEADLSDLRGLLKARGQTEALEHLPDGEATDMPQIAEEIDDQEADE